VIVTDMELLSKTINPSNQTYINELSRLQSAKSVWEKQQQEEMLGNVV
jgi:hypothetical protein